MWNDQRFNITFVSVVEKYEELYNYNDEKYSNRQAQEIAWQNVAYEVKSTATECKRRWRVLRVTFLRSLREKKTPRGSSGKKKKPHYLEDAMKFLVPFTKSRSQTGNAESVNEKVETASFSQFNDNETTTENHRIHFSEDEQEEILDKKFHESQAADEVETQLISRPTDFNTRLLEKSTNKTKLSSTRSWEHAEKVNGSPAEEDSDLLFFRSLLPDMKKLNDAQKRRYKQRMLAVYDEIINE